MAQFWQFFLIIITRKFAYDGLWSNARGTQPEYSSKPLKRGIVKRILVFKQKPDWLWPFTSFGKILIYRLFAAVKLKQREKNVVLISCIAIADAINDQVHGGRMGRKILRGSNYFCIFYSFELKLCKMVELCIPKNPMFFIFRFQRFLAGKWRHKVNSNSRHSKTNK